MFRHTTYIYFIKSVSKVIITLLQIFSLSFEEFVIFSAEAMNSENLSPAWVYWKGNKKILIYQLSGLIKSS